MAAIISVVAAIISTASFLALCFWVVRREMTAKTDTVKSAASQLAACRKNYMQARGSSEEQALKSILSNSIYIYRQSVMLYNQTLHKPWNQLPAFLMGFRKIKEVEDI